MKRTILLFLLLSVAFDVLFWDQNPGLNVLLFTILVIAATYFQFKEARGRIPVAVLAFGSLLSAFMVMMYGAGWALTANIISLMLFAGAVTSPQIMSVYYLIPQSLINFVLTPVNIGAKAVQVSKSNGAARGFVFYFLVIGAPLLIGILFYLLYLWGSPHFREANSGLMDTLIEYLGGDPGTHLLFLLWGICMSGYFLFKGYESLPEESQVKQIVRSRGRKHGPPGMGLKRELLAGVVLLLLLNAMITVVNYIDIKTVWFDFVVPEQFSLKQFVHNGTWILTACVFMSIAIVIWLFRGNQNFFWKSWVLRLLTYVWIAQNIVLTCSVFMRNYHYIRWHGLAYGRIFVIALMIMTVIALGILMLKVARKFTAHYFFRITSWIAYTFVIVCTPVNWDRLIFNHNVRHANSGQIDYLFYLQMSPDMLPELIVNKAAIDRQIVAHSHNETKWLYCDAESYWAEVYSKCHLHFSNIRDSDWQSWTVADANAFEPLGAGNKTLERAN